MELSIGKILLICLLGLLIFGPKKLPDIGRAAGESLREFKKSLNGLKDEINEKEEK
ncbi:twin-arginine translocase TatA/TatE family subunit [Bacillus sp. FJAT-49736]|uniref:twin-arginine translocase TatA/TatE family subunit n=1 Tax=Bacillus sp. FJAT-49736 TaxID=2833582 RepID=UPI001BCA2A2F|nr:twin-arginine translocase TatA/TatE family subunit [Bacillus sp. FJAT-49736]MBS4172255.1 twin-arginine translocase TatA/TatE family subunit [Bacillus sp. FJAT-49736]